MHLAWSGPRTSESPGADLVREGEGPVALIGDAFGGQVALEVAKLVPDRVDNVVLYDVAPYPWALRNLLAKTYLTTHPPAAFAAQARIAPPGWWSMMSGIDVSTGGEFLGEEVQSEVLKSLRRSDPVAMSYEMVRGMRKGRDLRATISSITRPILAVFPTGTDGKQRKQVAAVTAQYADMKGCLVPRTCRSRGGCNA